MILAKLHPLYEPNHSKMLRRRRRKRGSSGVRRHDIGEEIVCDDRTYDLTIDQGDKERLADTDCGNTSSIIKAISIDHHLNPHNHDRNDDETQRN